MPRPSQFPKDEHGSYVTVPLLLKMKNGDAVNIFRIKTDKMIFIIPSENSEKDGAMNSEQFLQKVYYKDSKSVTVDYFKKSDGQSHTINLRNLKEVRSIYSKMMAYLLLKEYVIWLCICTYFK